MSTWSPNVNAAGALLGALCVALVGCNSLLGNDPVRERVDPDASLARNETGGDAAEGGGGSGAGGRAEQGGRSGRAGDAGRGGRQSPAGGAGGAGGAARAGSGGRASDAGHGGTAAQGGNGPAAGSGGTPSAGAGGAPAPTCDSLQCPAHSSCDPQHPECKCEAGYDLLVGACVNRNECLTSNGGCDPHAMCEDTPGSFTCSCVAPYMGDGKTCTLDDGCQMRHCDAHASCTATGCKCLSGYQGDGVTCTRIDPCQSMPCKNGGACTPNPSGYDCNCNNTGFTGLTCEEPVDDCAVKPCKNGATCTDLVKDYKCTCKTGWSGKQCDMSSGCDYKGAHYDTGAKVDAGDGCNSCTCESTGQMSCTKNMCTVACGGIAGKMCPAEQYCNFPIGTGCGANDQQGMCAAIGGKVCPAIVQPVCGCDGKTYNNACSASAAGVSVRADGECASSGCDYMGVHYAVGASFPASDGCNTCSCTNAGKTVCTTIACTNGCSASSKCAAGQYCSFAADASCGQTGATGTCRTRPDVCTDVYTPVCGCDGKTYSNACFAAVAGVSVRAQDACVAP